MARALALAAISACLLAACGGSDEGAVKGAVNDLYAGFAERDAANVCDSLTESQKRVVARGGSGTSPKPRSCEQVMGIALGFVGDALKDAKEAKVTKVELDGDKARATVVYKGKPGNLGLARQSGDWKVSDFDLDKL